MKTILIKLLRPVAIKGCVTPAVGEPFEAPASEAAVVIGMGAAVEVSRGVSPPETIQTADPVPENRDLETQPAQSSTRKRTR